MVGANKTGSYTSVGTNGYSNWGANAVMVTMRACPISPACLATTSDIGNDAYEQ